MNPIEWRMARNLSRVAMPAHSGEKSFVRGLLGAGPAKKLSPGERDWLKHLHVRFRPQIAAARTQLGKATA